MTAPIENPDPTELADEDDARDWDVLRDGRMVEFADLLEPVTLPVEDDA